MPVRDAAEMTAAADSDAALESQPPSVSTPRYPSMGHPPDDVAVSMAETGRDVEVLYFRLLGAASSYRGFWTVDSTRPLLLDAPSSHL